MKNEYRKIRLFETTNAMLEELAEERRVKHKEDKRDADAIVRILIVNEYFSTVGKGMSPDEWYEKNYGEKNTRNM